jgi:hypothetical protein
VCGTDSTVNRRLVRMKNGTAVLVRVSVSVWDLLYGKQGASGCADYYFSVCEGWCECVEMTVR